MPIRPRTRTKSLNPALIPYRPMMVPGRTGNTSQAGSAMIDQARQITASKIQAE